MNWWIHGMCDELFSKPQSRNGGTQDTVKTILFSLGLRLDSGVKFRTNSRHRFRVVWVKPWGTNLCAYYLEMLASAKKRSAGLTDRFALMLWGFFSKQRGDIAIVFIVGFFACGLAGWAMRLMSQAMKCLLDSTSLWNKNMDSQKTPAKNKRIAKHQLSDTAKKPTVTDVPNVLIFWYEILIICVCPLSQPGPGPPWLQYALHQGQNRRHNHPGEM